MCRKGALPLWYSLISNTHADQKYQSHAFSIKDRVRIKVKINSWRLKKLLTTILTKRTEPL